MVGQIIHECFQLGERETKWGDSELRTFKILPREIPGKYFNILEIVRSGLSEGKGYLKKGPWKGKYNLYPQSFSWRVPSGECVQHQGQNPQYYLHLSINQAHSKSSHTNDHSCQKFYWSLPFIVSLSITSPLSSYEWVNMIVKRTGRNQNRILYLPSHLQIDITMGLHWRIGEELLLIQVWHDGKLYFFPTFVCSPSSLFLSLTPCREYNSSPHSCWAGPCEFLWPIEC